MGENNNYYKALFDQTNDAVFILSLDGKQTRVNKSASDMLGYTQAEIQLLSYKDLSAEENDSKNVLEILLSGKKVPTYERKFRKKDGAIITVEINAQLIMDEKGKPMQIQSVIRDISERNEIEKINGEISLKKMLILSEEFIQLYEGKLDYQKITNDFLSISGAKFAFFNLYDEDGKHFTTMGTAGDINLIKKGMQILGINLIGKTWEHDPIRTEKIKEKTITRFSSIFELTDNIIPKHVINLLGKHFDYGETVLIKILKNDIMLGDFTFFMAKGKGFNNDSIAEVYTRQLGMAITQKRTEGILKKERERLANIIKGTNVGTWEWNIQTGEILYNERWAEIIGYKLDEISPISTNTLIEFTHPDDLKKSNDMIDKALSKEIDYYDIEYRMKHKDGSWVWIQDKGNVISWTDDGKPYLMSGTHSDITEKKNRQLKIEYLSYRDQLTGLYNRRFFEEELNRLDNQRNLPLTLVVIDVNGLKLTNDAFGHIFGDKLLQRVAEVLKKESRKDEIIARIGGDEFVILLPKTNSDEASEILNRINKAVAKEKINSMNLSISFGWDTKQEIWEDMDIVFKKAEDNMYSRKMFERTSTRYKSVELIIKTLYEKSESEERHSANVSELCALLASSLELSLVEINELRTLGLMHDIGKIAIDENIINKPGPLNASDWIEVKRHPEIGYRILSSVNEYAAISEYVLAHHERWDGLGYPKGLKGLEIPWQARIVTITDAYDAMTSYRPYRKSLNKNDAINEIRKNMGTQFDPNFAKVFIEKVFPLLDDLKKD